MGPWTKVRHPQRLGSSQAVTRGGQTQAALERRGPGDGQRWEGRYPEEVAPEV